MTRVAERLSAAAALPALARAVASVDWRLRRRGLDQVLAAIEAMPEPRPSATPRELRAARRDARRIALVARWLPLRAHCLHRSIVLHESLRRRGVPSDFKIGVHKRGVRLAAHAWVEVAGTVVNDDPVATSRFAPLHAGEGPAVGWSHASGFPASLEIE